MACGSVTAGDLNIVVDIQLAAAANINVTTVGGVLLTDITVDDLGGAVQICRCVVNIEVAGVVDVRYAVVCDAVRDHGIGNIDVAVGDVDITTVACCVAVRHRDVPEVHGSRGDSRMNQTAASGKRSACAQDLTALSLAGILNVQCAFDFECAGTGSRSNFLAIQFQTKGFLGRSGYLARHLEAFLHKPVATAGSAIPGQVGFGLATATAENLPGFHICGSLHLRAADNTTIAGLCIGSTQSMLTGLLGDGIISILCILRQRCSVSTVIYRTCYTLIRTGMPYSECTVAVCHQASAACQCRSAVAVDAQGALIDFTVIQQNFISGAAILEAVYGATILVEITDIIICGT